MKYREEEPIKITREQILESAKLRKEKQWARLRIGEDGRLYVPDGLPVSPDFPIGPRQDQKELFIEYEWTFGRGRGLAYEVTHTRSSEIPEEWALKRYGYPWKSIHEDYRALAFKIGLACRTGSQEEVTALKREIEEFRLKYSNLFKERSMP